MENTRPTAFITDATSGIGKEFARRFAASGYDLIITGRRYPELKKVADTIEAEYPVRVKFTINDLADGQYCQQLCEEIKANGNVEILVNNAGFGINHAFHMTCIEEIRSMIFTHMVATVELIHAVLPGMMQHGTGTIINVSSLAAFTPGLTRSIYLGTKTFIHYFTEALGTEINHSGIKIQSLCPGMTMSDFHRNICDDKFRKKMHLLPFMSAEKVVAKSLNALDKRWILCVPGAWNKLFYILARLIPTRLLMKISGFRQEEPYCQPGEKTGGQIDMTHTKSASLNFAC